MPELDLDNIVENIEPVEKPVLRRRRAPSTKNRDERITAKVKQSFEDDCTLGVVVPGNMSGLLSTYILNGARDLGISVRLTFTFEGNDGIEVTTTKKTEVPKDDRQVLLRFHGRNKQRAGSSSQAGDLDYMEST